MRFSPIRQEKVRTKWNPCPNIMAYKEQIGVRILNREAVLAALPMEVAVEAVRWAYRAWSAGQAQMPQRIHLELPEQEAVSLFMPAFVSGSPEGGFAPALTVKAVSIFPKNAACGLPAIQGACLALLDGATLTALRTGAGSGVASDLLARPEAATLAVLGAGAQGATQVEGVCAVRSIRTVWIHDHTPGKAEDLAAKLAGRGRIPMDIRSTPTAAEAIQDADIVCTATPAGAILFADADLKPGVHINAIGSFRPTQQELPSTTVVRARVFVDSRHDALSEAGDLIQPIEAGLITPEHVLGEVGDLLLHRLPGRQSAEEITLFKSVGLAVQDAAAASAALARAEALGIGQIVAWD